MSTSIPALIHSY